MYIELMLDFFIGWFGGYWWRGMEYDAPNPKDPQPWQALALGVIAGAAAVLVSRLAGPIEDGFTSIVVSIAVGRVAVGVFRPILSRF